MEATCFSDCTALARLRDPTNRCLINALTGQVICADVAGDGHNFAWQWPRLFLDTDARGGNTCTEGQIETGHIFVDEPFVITGSLASLRATPTPSERREQMRSKIWMIACVVGFVMLTSNFALAQGNGHGKGHGKHSGDDAQDYYKDHDRENVRGWYDEHEGHLPPGLAKKDRLPPGLEKQLVRRGSLPPGLQKRLQPCPRDLERELPPPPPECAHVLLGGHIVLLNQRTNVVVDIVHFEIR